MNYLKAQLTRLAQWWLGPPVDVRRIECPGCKRYVATWRRYADRTVECIRCAENLQPENFEGVTE